MHSVTLTVESLVVSICTARFEIKRLCVCTFRALCALYGYRKKKTISLPIRNWLLSFTARSELKYFFPLRNWLLSFTARSELKYFSPRTKLVAFVYCTVRTEVFLSPYEIGCFVYCTVRTESLNPFQVT